jgi:hypothetical protein
VGWSIVTLAASATPESTETPATQTKASFDAIRMCR